MKNKKESSIHSFTHSHFHSTTVSCHCIHRNFFRFSSLENHRNISLSLLFPIPRLWDLASPFRISNPGERLNRHKRIISRRCLSGSRMAAAGWTRGRGEARRLHGRTDSTVSSLHAGRGRDVKLHVAGVFAIYVGALAKQQGVPCVHGWPSAHNRWHLRWLVIRTRAPTHPQLERLLKLAGFSPRAGYIERHFQLRFDATVFIRGD